jgi:hypothetical protein
MRILRRLARWTARGAAGLLFLLTLAWTCAALIIDLAPGVLGWILAVALVLGASLGLVVRRTRRAAAAAFALVFALCLWAWFAIEPANDRPWRPDVSRPPRATFAGDLVTIRDVRNFDYDRGGVEIPRWYDKTYDLTQLVAVDLVLSHWGSPAIAHTILSFVFRGGEHLAMSVEARKEVGEEYSSVLGFFRQYELFYVVADERDVIRLRTNYRHEEVYLYRTWMSPKKARIVLMNYLMHANRLADHPEFYNALTDNCTTKLVDHVGGSLGARRFDPRLVFTGYSDEFAYDAGAFGFDLPFAELKRLSDVRERALAADRDPEFSKRIREGLPTISAR